MRKIYLKVIGAFALFCSLNVQGQMTFTYTGSIGTYVVPIGITSIEIEAKGSKGQDGSPALGGNGATMSGEFTVSPGDVLTYYVGGNSAGMKAGGDGSWVENTTTGTLLIVAGGGGGATHSQIGAGAPTTTNGTASVSHPGYTNGAPGVGGNGGGAGIGAWGTGGGGGWLSAGSAGLGSPGGIIKCRGSFGTTYAAGGGGGYSGGGGVDMDSGWGTGGGGAGGSYNAGTSQVNVAANNAGLGQIVITELCSAMSLTVSDATICLGESFTATADGDGAVSWTGGLVNGVPFTPAAIGIYEYTATSSDASDCPITITIGVFAIPTVVANVTDTEICLGETVVFTGSGATSYTWDMGVVNGVPFEPLTLGTDTYTVTGTNGSGCSNTATVDVTALFTPTIVANASETTICSGDPLTLFGTGGTSYVWDMGVTNNVEFTPDLTGVVTYIVVGTSSFSTCTGTDSIDITIAAPIEITYTTVIEDLGSDGEIDITVTGGIPPYSFDWDNDGTGDFDDTEDLTGLTGGTYVVMVECDAGCFMNESITLNSLSGINESNGLMVAVYPNPTNDVVNIQFEGAFTYELSAVNGELILKGSSVNKKELDLDQLSEGVYFVTITADGKTSTVKLVKN